MEWMYSQGPSATNQTTIDEDKEAFLLGKKSLNSLVEKPKEVEQVSQFKPSKNTVYGLSANTSRDVQNKIREDPLFAFKRQEQASLEALMNNPLRLKQLKKQAEKMKRKSGMPTPHVAHHSGRNRSRSPPPKDLERGSKSPKRRHSRSPRRYRDKSGSPSRKRSRSPGSRRDGHRHRRERSMSRSPPRSRRDVSRSPRRYRDQSPQHRPHPSRSPQVDEEAEKRDRLAKLEAMKINAQKLGQERAIRLEAEQEKEDHEVKKDMESRQRRHDSELGASGSFLADMHRQAYADKDASEMIQRNRAFAQKGSRMTDR